MRWEISTNLKHPHLLGSGLHVTERWVRHDAIAATFACHMSQYSTCKPFVAALFAVRKKRADVLKKVPCFWTAASVGHLLIPRWALQVLKLGSGDSWRKSCDLDFFDRENISHRPAVKEVTSPDSEVCFFNDYYLCIVSTPWRFNISFANFYWLHKRVSNFF